jgi:carboxyl-terminal processing protease
MARLRTAAVVLIVAVAAFYLGSLVEFQYGGYAPDWVKTVLLYRPPTRDLDLQGLEEVFQTIQQHYLKPNADGHKLTEGAASGMVGALNDPFSRYLTPEEYALNQTFLQGSFGGIGASVLEKGTVLQVDSILPGTPAQRAGLQVGDIITTVDGQSTQGWTADQAVARIRGKVDTHVVLGIDRNGQQLTLDLVRKVITVASVAAHVFDNQVLYVRIFDFGDRTSAEFDTALKDNLKGPVNRVLLDLRDNPGGFVDAANDVLSEFIRSGTTTILVQRGAKEEVRTVSGTGRAFDARLVVLVNENTASASEITAGAIKDHSRGVLVGTKTFGKGSVQQDFLVRDGDLHLTIAHWLTPNRHSIEKNGIVPDDEVKLANTTDEYAIDRTPSDFSRDTQLAEGLKVLER